MALSTQTGSAVSDFPWKYDVFLSFRGTDTRKGFTDHLYHKLQWQGIRTFRDDPHLERGTTIGPELLTAIEQSRFAIVILSPNYARSTWCLRELSKIVQCMEERVAILPIFYEVEPSDVRQQNASFAEAFAEHEHEKKFGKGNKEVKGWRDALTKVASLAGWSSENYGYETVLIREIVEKLLNELHPSLTVFGSSEKLVGMCTKLEEIDLLLDRKSYDVRSIGIWGMGGLGKTTLARLVYEKISHQYDVCIFLANVREISATHGIIHLQQQILSQILKEESVQVWNVDAGMDRIKRCLCNKTVLLVLDDVDKSEQLEKLVGEQDWFCSRSRIIITTRDRHVLVTHGIKQPYELMGLKEDEALQLFCWKAFRKSEPEKDYADYSKSFVMYAGGVPLALKILGSFLCDRRPDSWSSALQRLQQTPNPKVTEMLKISFDGLEEKDKKIFLDISCFRRLYIEKSFIELVYESVSRISIDVLVERSLLTITSDNQVAVHDLVYEMGCEIVRRESNEEPGGRSRLWLRNDIFHIFTKNTGTEAIEGIMLHLEDIEEADWNLEELSKMCRLKLLYVHNLWLSVGPKYLPNALRILKWRCYPSKSLPPGFQPDELIELSLPYSKIHHLWKGIKYLNKLNSIDLSYSKYLTRTPDFTGTPNLEKLVLKGCINLVKIHPSIALLKRLKIWNFRNCKSIKSLPSEVNMEFLETFDVSGCSKLKSIPECVGQTRRLSKLYLGGTALEKLPTSIEHLGGSLMELDLSGSVIREQPYSFFLRQNLIVSSFRLFQRQSPHPLTPVLVSLKHLSSLTALLLNDCNLCEGDIPSDIGSLSSLKWLGLSGNNFRSLPESMHLLSKLYVINLWNCKRLEQLPKLPAGNVSLNVFADDCTSLKVFPDPLNLCELYTFKLSCANCFEMVAYQDSSYLLYSVLKRLVEEPPRSFQHFYLSFPGSEIVDWFSNQCIGNSITEKVPGYASNSGLIGLAVCGLIGSAGNPSAHTVYGHSDPDVYHIDCYWEKSYATGSVGFGGHVRKIVSDHLILAVVPIYRQEEPCNDVKFKFRIDDRRIEVKKCGARALYEHDLEELISKMNQSNRGVSVYEAMDEEEGAMVLATTTRSGGSDDEYYSAEE